MIKTPIVKFKRSSVAGFIPQTGDLSAGEIFINFADKKIYTKNESGVVVSVGGSDTLDWNAITNKPSLATVATSGSYSDLINTPSLFSGSYNDLTNKPTTDFGNY